MSAVRVNLGGGQVATLEPDLYGVDRALLAPLLSERRPAAPLALAVDGLGPQGEILEAPELEGIYLFHLDPPYRHAAHYLDWAYNVRKRVREHRSGGVRCSPLLRAQTEAGGAILLARVWPGGDRTLERKMKNQGGLSRHCPLCRAAGRWHR